MTKEECMNIAFSTGFSYLLLLPILHLPLSLFLWSADLLVCQFFFFRCLAFLCFCSVPLLSKINNFIHSFTQFQEIRCLNTWEQKTTKKTIRITKQIQRGSLFYLFIYFSFRKTLIVYTSQLHFHSNGLHKLTVMKLANLTFSAPFILILINILYSQRELYFVVFFSFSFSFISSFVCGGNLVEY